MGKRAPAPRTVEQLVRRGLLLAVPAVLAAQAPTPPVQLLIEGGNTDDQGFARAAAGRVKDAASLAAALEAIRGTDRFSDVQGRLEAGAGGMVARVHLVPWPVLRGWTLKDDGGGEAPTARTMFADLRHGIRAGTARREAWRDRGEQVLRAAGFPAATVAVAEAEGGARLLFTIHRGAPARVRRLVLEGAAGPYGESHLWKLVQATPGRTLWTLAFRREALARLRKRFLKDHRYEWRGDFQFGADGTLRLLADPGPVVELKAEGASLGFGGISELAPLARAERYGPELLDEGDRRIFRYLRTQGYLDPSVTHRREVLAGPAEKPERVRVTYVIRPGAPVVLAEVRFEGNETLPDKELKAAAGLPLGIWGWGVPKANPDLLQGLEDRVRAHYLRKGYNEVRVRRAVPALEKGRWLQTLIIREGPLRELSEVRVQLPDHAPYIAWSFAEDLLPVLGDRPPRREGLEPPDGSARIFESDRPQTRGILGRLERGPVKDGLANFSLKLSKPVPYVKGDLVVAVAAMRRRLSALGIQRPKEDLDFDDTAGLLKIQVRIPESPRIEVQRLVVQGSDATRARAILREAELEVGKPMSPEGLGQAQARIANLGAFQRVDLESPPERVEGDLSLRLTERNPWVFSHSFGYDRSQGYHIGSSVQRLNVGGMGRSIDFGIRASDATLGEGKVKDKLNQLFPTGPYPRSVDIYSLGYSDPRFGPALFGNWIPDRTQYRIEAAYIVERQNTYEFHRRRVLNTFDWHLDSTRVIQVGHRYERVRVGLQGIAEHPEVFEDAQLPGGQVVISAPFAQFIKDTRDSAFDPTRGNLFKVRLELANQLFGTSSNSSFVKLDVRHQWNWPIGHNASNGVAVLGMRIGIANPTAASSERFPLSERFFAGGPFTHRGVEPDALGPRVQIPVFDPATGRQKVGPDGNLLYLDVPAGGQALALVNMEYRFPVYTSWLWGEVFVDTGQVYRSIHPGSRHPDPTNLTFTTPAPFPHFRTALGVGLIVKLGLPIKVEYSMDLKHILGQTQTREERDTQLSGVLISAGFQF